MGKKAQPAPYPLRMPDVLRRFFELTAEENGRSLNSELVFRLEACFKKEFVLLDKKEIRHE